MQRRGAGALEVRDAADAAAVRLCLAGDREAFGDLVGAYQDRIYGLALRWCHGNRADAADITQDVFLRAYAALARFDPARPFAPWLLRIAINRCRDAARRHRARPAADTDLDWETLAEGGDGPEARAIAAEERRAVRAAVDALPQAQRLLVVLAYDRRMPLAQVAAALGLPLSMVKNRLMRARRVLAKRLEETGVEAGEHDVRRRTCPVAPVHGR